MNPPVQGHAWPSTPEERTHATWIHLSVLTALMGGIILTLILWVAKRDKSAFIDDHGKEVLNAQITFLLYWVLGMIVALAGLKIILGVLFIGTLVALIRGVKAAQRGALYRYPMCLRFVR